MRQKYYSSFVEYGPNFLNIESTTYEFNGFRILYYIFILYIHYNTSYFRGTR
jgi:hypothetical protein